MLNFSSMLTKVRDDLNISVTELARRTGFCRKQIQQWERGKIFPPTGEDLDTLCKAMGASPEQRNKLFEAAYEFHLERVRERYRKLFAELGEVV